MRIGVRWCPNTLLMSPTTSLFHPLALAVMLCPIPWVFYTSFFCWIQWAWIMSSCCTPRPHLCVFFLFPGRKQQQRTKLETVTKARMWSPLDLTCLWNHGICFRSIFSSTSNILYQNHVASGTISYRSLWKVYEVMFVYTRASPLSSMVSKSRRIVSGVNFLKQRRVNWEGGVYCAYFLVITTLDSLSCVFVFY